MDLAVDEAMEEQNDTQGIAALAEDGGIVDFLEGRELFLVALAFVNLSSSIFVQGGHAFMQILILFVWV